jgi:hypothetical protein
MRKIFILYLYRLISIGLFFFSTQTFAEIGKITESTGLTEIQRNRESISGETNSGVEMNDAIITARSRAQITFVDDTKVQISEQSKLLIDDFVFDPNQVDAGKLSIKVAIGTARYASGQIAHNDPASVKIETPTATIGVRGTDFSMTVDELGRSLIVLLPSCPVGYKNIERDCKTGKIDVTTEMGVVHLDKPFQATTTSAKEANPSKAVILKLSMEQINNMLILTPPKRAEETTTNNNKTALDINFLDKDLLKFDDLNINLLNANTGLGINQLDSSFLINMLDLLNSQLLENMLNSGEQMLPNYKPNKAAGLYYFIDYNSITLYRTAPSHYAQVTVDKDSQTVLNLTQDDVRISQTVNRNGGTVINIRQGQ